MPVQIGAKRQADFDDPLQMLSDCHRRIESFLSALLGIARGTGGRELDEAIRKSLKNSLEYFRDSGARHTADEEESLFPRMRESAAGAAAVASIEALQSDHLKAERAHAEIDALGSRWLKDSRLSPEDAGRMVQLLEELAGLYARHIHIEDHELFPAAGRALTAEQITAIGGEMARRRGIKH